MQFPQNKPLSSILLKDTIANFPSLRYKFDRVGLSADGKDIVCPITGAVVTTSATFDKVGGYGFVMGGSGPSTSIVGANFASVFTKNDMLFVSNADIASGSSGGFTVGNNSINSAVPDPEIKANTTAGYSYLNYTDHYSNVPAVNISGGIGAMCGAIAPFENIIEKYAVYSDGTTAPSKVTGVNKDAGTDFSAFDWTFDDSIKIVKGSGAQTIYYGLYILEFKDGRPTDEIINQGLLWMAANRDKGLPPMWKDLA